MRNFRLGLWILCFGLIFPGCSAGQLGYSDKSEYTKFVEEQEFEFFRATMQNNTVRAYYLLDGEVRSVWVDSVHVADRNYLTASVYTGSTSTTEGTYYAKEFKLYVTDSSVIEIIANNRTTIKLR